MTKILRNAKTLFSRPSLAIEYCAYVYSMLVSGGRSTRELSRGLKVTELSGFGEFHSCAAFVDSREWNFLESYPFAPGALLDVGANLGIVSLILGKRFPDRELHAFEPNSSTFHALKTNFKVNGCSNLRAHCSVVAAHDGQIAFDANPKDRGTTHIARDNREHVVSVPCVTLDKFVQQNGIGSIGFLKVDAEGYETLVFQGAKELLRRQQVALIYYEVCPERTRLARFDPQGPSRLLQEHGYNLHTIGAGQQLLPAKLSGIATVASENWVAVRP